MPVDEVTTNMIDKGMTWFCTYEGSPGETSQWVGVGLSPYDTPIEGQVVVAFMERIYPSGDHDHTTYQYLTKDQARELVALISDLL